MPRPIAPDTPPDAALRQIVATCRDDLLKNRTIVLESRRPVGIHQTRVALRRMRAALGLFKEAVRGPIEERLLRALAAEAQWLASECGPSRDLHVFMTETIEDAPPAVKRIANRLARIHLERARAALSDQRFGAFDAQLTAFIEVPAAKLGRLDAFAREMLDKRHSKVEQRGRKIEHLDGKRLHRLRIAIKKLRYASTFLAPAFDSRRAKAYIEATTRLQGALGAMNDREVAGQILADIANAARPSEKVGSALARLAKQAASGNKRRRRKLERAWRKFEKAGRFWRA
ncbi:MAG: CHAD domain-containing protein [Alphaproteobacteria bacterium]|nr:CHAD domain-containing protein [Alphaproteobacteria bacterium]